MARLSNIYGTQPQAGAAPARHGGGGGQNRRPPNRGGGGGGGGGKKKVPNTGLYGDNSGEAEANLDPEQYIRNLLQQAGVMDFSGSQYGDWANEQLVNQLLSGYNAAQALNQQLSIADYLRNAYGAGYGGKKGQDFSGGTLNTLTQPLADQWNDYRSNTQSQQFINEQAINQGGILPGGGNVDFQDWLKSTFMPELEADWRADQASATGPGQPGDQRNYGEPRHRVGDLPTDNSLTPLELNEWLKQQQGIGG